MVEYIGLLKIKVQRGKNLAVRDMLSSDPYVVMTLGPQVSHNFPFIFVPETNPHAHLRSILHASHWNLLKSWFLLELDNPIIFLLLAFCLFINYLLGTLPFLKSCVFNWLDGCSAPC